MEKDEKKSAAAKARAASLTPEKRAEIGRKAAAARWDRGKNVPQSQYPGMLPIAGMEIECDVLSDGTRVLTQTAFMDAMGMYYSGWVSQNRSAEALAADIPQFLAFKSLEPFVAKHLGDLQSISVEYRTKTGNLARGIRAEIIPKICEVWLDAAEAGPLGKRQAIIAEKAKVLIRALAHTGIIALVDEVTGYQDIRAKDALAKIFTQFLADERQKWTQTFPLEFYREIFRLRGWDWKPWTTKRPQVIALWTNDFVYDRLAPGLTDELDRLNPITSPGQRSSKNTQWFNEDRGHPKLKEHISGVSALLRAADSWSSFKSSLNRAYPKFNENLELPLTGGSSKRSASLTA